MRKQSKYQQDPDQDLGEQGSEAGRWDLVPVGTGWKAFDLRHWISAPILELAEADVKLAERFVSFAKEHGFERFEFEDLVDVPPEKLPKWFFELPEGYRKLLRDPLYLGHLKMVKFMYERPTPIKKKDPEPEEKPKEKDPESPEIEEKPKEEVIEGIVVHIPLLSLYPMPLLQVEAAEVEYGFRVVGLNISQSQSTSSTVAERPGYAYHLQGMLAPLAGAGSTDKYQKATSDANLQVKVKIDRSDIPAGVATLLNTMTNATYSRIGELVEKPEEES